MECNRAESGSELCGGPLDHGGERKFSPQLKLVVCKQLTRIYIDTTNPLSPQTARRSPGSCQRRLTRSCEGMVVSDLKKGRMYM